MPVDYLNSKVYKIEPRCLHEEEDIYIGSTAQTALCLRFQGHKKDYNNRKGTCSVHALFDKYGVDNCEIVLLESCPCKTKDELFARESFYMKTMKCVNSHIMGRTKKEYRDSHKVKIALYQVKWRNGEKKEEILQKRYDYHHEHREDMLLYSKNYYEKNKESISAKNKEIVTCECGCDLAKYTINTHRKTAKHLKLMQKKQ